MKKIPFLLFASVLANLALVALVLSTPDPDDAAKINPTHAAGASSTKPSNVSVAGVDPGLWSDLGGDDLPSQATRLREAGFPPSVVRTIVSAQIYESYAARRRALMPEPRADLPFWKVDPPADAKTLAAQRELSQEQTKLLRELLGSADPIDDPAYAAAMRRQYGDLAPEKISLVQRIQQEFGERQQQVLTVSRLAGGPSTPDDRVKLAVLEKEMRAEIARTLTPQEFEDYELRSSNTASQMRNQLSAFGPNENEFRTIYRLQSKFDEQFNTQTMVSLQGPAQQEFMQQRTEAQKQLTAEIAAALGGDRGAEYAQAIDNDFQQIYRVIERLELPKEAAVQVWTAQKDIEQRLTSLRTLPPAARVDQIAALAQEANSRVLSAIGDRGYEVYKQYGGFWIQNLEQQAAAPNRAAPPAPEASGGRGGAGARGGLILTR